MVFQGTSRRSPYGLPRAYDFRTEDPTARPEHRTGFNPRLIPNPYLAADHRVILHHHTARKSGLRRDHNMPANPAVVPHMHHVIEFGAFADHRNAQSSAIHARIRTNFHKIADLYSSNLGEFVIAAIIEH